MSEGGRRAASKDVSRSKACAAGLRAAAAATALVLPGAPGSTGAVRATRRASDPGVTGGAGVAALAAPGFVAGALPAKQAPTRPVGDAIMAAIFWHPGKWYEDEQPKILGPARWSALR